MQISTVREVTTNIVGSVDFTISADAAKIFSMLSTALYTDKEKAVCYELGANCYDAHIMNGNQEVPFLIVAPTTLEPQVKFRDYGPGLSEPDVYRLLTVYGASDKQGDNSQIGGYGIGAKSPAAVTDTWTVISYHGGKGREFMVFINDHGVPSLTKIREFDSTETGLEVVIPVAANRFGAWNRAFSDAFQFYPVKPIFKNVTCRYSDSEYAASGTGWKLRKSSSLATFITTHRGYSPDRDKLSHEIKDKHLANLLNLPLEIDFPIGELSLSLSREHIQYTKHTVAAIVKRLEHVRDELTSQVKTVLDTATDGLQYRINVTKVAKDFFDESLKKYFFNESITSGVKSFLLQIINGKYGVVSLEDDINTFKVKVCGAQEDFSIALDALNGKVYNGKRFKKIDYKFNCFRTYHIVARNDYTNGGYIRFSISLMQRTAIVLADVRDSAARVKHNFDPLKSKYAILVNKDIFPPEMKPYIIKASSLPKAPRVPRVPGAGRSKKILESNVYAFRANSMTKTDLAEIKKTHNGKIAYVTFKDARNQSGVSEIFWKVRFAFEALGGWAIVGIREGDTPPKGIPFLKDAAVKEYERLHADKAMQKSALLSATYQAMKTSYNSSLLIFLAHPHLATKKNSVWNTLQDQWKGVHTAKRGDWDFYDRLALALGHTKPALNAQKNVDSISADLYNTYSMLKYSDVSVKASVLEEYLNLVGK